MKSENFDITVIIEALKGTSTTLDEQLNSHYPEMDYEDLTDEDHAAIDDAIFLCEQCGWYCETSEANENPEGDGYLCNDCHEQQEEN